MRVNHILLLSLALFGRLTFGQYGEDGEGGEGGYGGGGGGGGGEGGEPQAPPAAELQELLSVEDFDAFLEHTDPSVIGAFTAKEMDDPNAVLPDGWDVDEDGEWAAPVIENPKLAEYKTISSSLYGYRFAYTVEPELLLKLKAKKGGLFVFKSPKFVSKEHGDRPRERFPSEKLSESTVSNWLATKSQPLVGPYTMTNKNHFKTAVLVIFMNLDFEKNGKGVAYVLKRARKAAASLKGKLAIAVASLSEMNYDLGDYGLTSTKPTADVLMGIKSGSDFYGASDDASFTGPALTAFADSFLAGKLAPFVKPEPEVPPPSDDADAESPRAYGDDDDAKEEM